MRMLDSLLTLAQLRMHTFCKPCGHAGRRSSWFCVCSAGHVFVRNPHPTILRRPSVLLSVTQGFKFPAGLYRPIIMSHVHMY